MTDAISDQRRVVTPDVRPFPDGPWGIKWIAGADKRAATAAAKRADQTMGVWLGHAIRAYVAAEREPSPGDVLTPGAIVRIDPPRALSIEDLERVYALAARMAADQGRALPWQGRMMRAVRVRLTAIVGL